MTAFSLNLAEATRPRVDPLRMFAPRLYPDEIQIERKSEVIRNWGAFALAGSVGHGLRLVYLVDTGEAPSLVRALVQLNAPGPVVRAVIREACLLDYQALQAEFGPALRSLLQDVAIGGPGRPLALYRGGFGTAQAVSQGFSWTRSVEHARWMVRIGLRDIYGDAFRDDGPGVVVRAVVPRESVAFESWHDMEREVVLWRAPEQVRVMGHRS